MIQTADPVAPLFPQQKDSHSRSGTLDVSLFPQDSLWGIVVCRHAAITSGQTNMQRKRRHGLKNGKDAQYNWIGER